MDSKKKPFSGMSSLFGDDSPFISQGAVRTFMQKSAGGIKDFAELIRPETAEEQLEGLKLGKLKELVNEICKICGYEETPLLTEDKGDLLALALAAISEKLFAMDERMRWLEDKLIEKG